MLSKSPLRESTPLIGRTSRRILEMVEHGQFHPSHPLPSRRALAERLGVSHSTVSKAMEILREQGVVESQEGSYTFLKSLEGEASLGDRNDPEATHISLWFNAVTNVRQIRRDIVRRRFQRRFARSWPGLAFSNEKFDLNFGEFRTRQMEAFFSESQPTLGEFPQTYLSALDAHGLLAEMEVPGSAAYLDLLDDRYLEHCYFDGKLRFLPFACSFSYLACNGEMLRQAGIDPKKDFASWEDFADQCERLKRRHGVEPLQVSERGLFWLLSQWIYQADSTLPCAGRLPLIDWGSEAARIGMDFLLEMVVERGLIRVMRGDQMACTSPFLAGQAPLAMDEILLPSALELDQTDAVIIKPFPPGPNGARLSLMNTVGWTVNVHATSSTRRRAAEYALSWEKWTRSGEGAETMRRMGVAPALVSLYKDPLQDRSCSEKIPKDWQDTFSQLRECGRWEAADSDLVANALAPILCEAIAQGRPNAPALLKHFLLAQYSEGIRHNERRISIQHQPQTNP